MLLLQAGVGHADSYGGTKRGPIFTEFTFSPRYPSNESR